MRLAARHADATTANLMINENWSGAGGGRAHLHRLGLDISGVDLSPGMVAVARRAYPDLRFEVGSLTELSAPDGSLAGLVSWYSLIHLPPELLPEVFAGFHRVLVPGGHLLLAVKAGDRLDRREQAYGYPVEYDVYWLSPQRLAAQLAAAGFAVTATTVREPADGERQPQAFLLAHRY
ncbi:class I SAM-dependent methyltransferase [Micromonospora chalcea]